MAEDEKLKAAYFTNTSKQKDENFPYFVYNNVNVPTLWTFSSHQSYIVGELLDSKERIIIGGDFSFREYLKSNLSNQIKDVNTMQRDVESILRLPSLWCVRYYK